MVKLSVKLIIGLLAAGVLLIFFNYYFMAGRSYSIIRLGDPLAGLFSATENIGGFFDRIKNWHRLSSENSELKEANIRLVSDLAELQRLKDDNKFLREALSLPAEMRDILTTAHVYYYNYTPGSVNFLINKGERDGISRGDIVMTEERVLVGRISEVFSDSSRVSILSDEDFKITVSIIGRKTKGIARGSADGSVYLDLVVQDEEVTTGDTVASSGDDLFPASLIVGTIDYVDSAGAGVFKKIEIRPAMEKIKIASVLILKK